MMFIFGTFAGMKHITQFNESLKKSYYRASRAFARQKKRYREYVQRMKKKDDNPSFIEENNNDLNLSTVTSASQAKELSEKTQIEKNKIDKEFRDNFSFGNFLELVWRVEYLEGELAK